MKAKFFLLLLVPLFALFVMTRLSAEDLPVLSPDGSDQPGEVVQPDGGGEATGGAPAPKKETAKGGGAGASIMTAEQGEDLAKKLDKLQEDQKKILEKLDDLHKEMDFLKASVRTR